MKKFNKKRIVLLIILILIISAVTAIIIFNRSKADEVLEINTSFKDINGSVEDETAILTTTDYGESGVAVELPDNINGKMVDCYIIDANRVPSDEETTDNSNSEENLDSSNNNELSANNENSAENSNSEDGESGNVESNSTSSDNNETSEKNTNDNNSDENDNIDADDNSSAENSSIEGQNEKYDKLDFELPEGKAIIYPGENLYLKEDEIKNLELSLEVNYDAIKIDENTLLYNKQIETENENNKISASGYMPINAEIKATKVEEEDIAEKTKNEVDEKATLQCAYDIKILVGEEEFEPESIGKELEITISGIDDTTNKDYTVLHIDNENKVESVNVTQKEENKIMFDATSFSTYTVYSTDTTDSTLDSESDTADAPMLMSASSTIEATTVSSTTADEWDGIVPTTTTGLFTYGGNGQSASTPILITSGSELAYLAQHASDSAFSGKYFQLAKDINLANHSWTPIGTFSNPFVGYFDGNGHTISNVSIEVSSYAGTRSSYGVFGAIGGTGTTEIKNIEFNNINISITSTTEIYYKSTSDNNTCMLHVGTICGSQFTDSTIQNIIVKNSAITAKNAKLSDIRSQIYIGGLVGAELASNSMTTGTASGQSGTHKIKNCFSDVDITSSIYTKSVAFMLRYCTGGIIGCIWSSSLTLPDNCLYTGTINSKGMIGPIYGGVNSTITNTGTNTSASAQGVTTGNARNTVWLGENVGTPTIKSYYYNYTATNGTETKAYTDDDVEQDSNAKRLNTTISASGVTYYPNAGNIQGINRGWFLRETGSDTQAADSVTDMLSSFNSYISSSGTNYTKWNINTKGEYSFKPMTEVSITDNHTGTFNANVTLNYTPSSTPTYTYKWYIDGEAQTETSSTLHYTFNWWQEHSIKVLASADSHYALCEMTVGYTVDLNLVVNGSTLTAELSGTAVTAGLCSTSDFNYVWKKTNIYTGEQEIIADATSYTYKSDGTGEYTLYAELKADNSLNFTKTHNYITSVIYCSYSSGKDSSGRGYTPSTPVKTLSYAYGLLDSSAAMGNNIIVFMSNDTTNSYFPTDGSSTYNKKATITGKYNGTSYNPKLRMKDSKFLVNDTTFAYITFDGGGSSEWFMYCQGHSLTMDIGLEMQNYGKLASSAGAVATISNGAYTTTYNSPKVHIVGGMQQPKKNNGDYTYKIPATQNNNTIILKSGTYGRVILSGRYDKTVEAIQGTPSDPFVTHVIVDIQDSNSTAPTNGYDINVLLGGRNRGSTYSNVTIDIKNGKVGRLLGGNLGQDESGTSFPRNSFYGTSIINIDSGATIAEVYGASFGRSNGNDCYYFGTINITLNGGTILTNLFGAGAGGATGYSTSSYLLSVNNSTSYGRSYMQSVGLSATTINITINSGTVNGSVYGGGYGYSPILNSLTTDMGDVFGNANIYINGGTIEGSVYGAGKGYYIDGKPNLARFEGNTYIEVKGGSIGGSIYGAGQGLSNADTIAKLAGTTKVVLDIEDSTFSNNIYGGADIAATEGTSTSIDSPTTEIDIKSGTYTGSIYGGGNNGTVTGTSNVNITGGTVKKRRFRYRR